MRSRAFERPVSLALAAIGTVAVTAIGRAMHLNANTMGFAYLIVVLLAALRGGLLAGTLASIVATLCYNYFFFPPLYTFVIHEAANWVALAAFLITSVVVSRLVLAARIQADRAEQRTHELETLYGLSVDLFTAADRAGALGEASERALTLLGARIARTASGVYFPIIVGDATVGAIVASESSASRQALVWAARLIGLAIERERLIEEHAHLQALRESETLKTSLLRAISHDLSTPLTAITIHTQALRRKGAHDEELQDAIAGIADETARLHRRIDNLLAMARLEAGKAKPRPEPTPPADLFHAVRDNLPLLFQSRAVTVHVDDDCPDANVDPSLALEVLVNLVENAHRVSPPGAPLELVARIHPLDPSQVRMEVLDRGPGLPSGVADADGNVLPGATSDVAQRGLGLEIACSLAAANGGSIGLTPRRGGGTVARLDVPAAPLPAEQPA